MPKRARSRSSSANLDREVRDYLARPGEVTLYWPGGSGGGGNRKRRSGSPVVRPHQRTSAKCVKCGQFHTQAEHARHAGPARGKVKAGRAKPGKVARARPGRARPAPSSTPRSTLEIVMDAAARAPARDRLGRSVMISRLYPKIRRQTKMSIDKFKRWLVEQNRALRLALVRLDLPEFFPQKDVEASEIEDLGATFHMVIDPRHRDP